MQRRAAVELELAVELGPAAGHEAELAAALAAELVAGHVAELVAVLAAELVAEHVAGLAIGPVAGLAVPAIELVELAAARPYYFVAQPDGPVHGLALQPDGPALPLDEHAPPHSFPPLLHFVHSELEPAGLELGPEPELAVLGLGQRLGTIPHDWLEDCPA